MQIRFIDSIHQIDAARWNQLCPDHYPFVRHEFIAALEDTHCTGAATGWQAQHLLVVDGETLIAAMPGYLKTHSYGEYVFDWAWADAYRRYGFRYYPKWIGAIPFTPCTGARLLYAAPQVPAQLVAQVAQALSDHCAAQGLSGWHCLFPERDLSTQLATHHGAQRLGCQFHWFNRNYRDFDDFLAQMSSRKRKNIVKERQQVHAQAIRFSVKDAAQISAADMDLFYRLYRNTYLKRSGHDGYLSPAFFRRMAETFREHLVLICALQQQAEAETIIAAALFFRDQQTLYGRYWGCFEEYQFLHFETCYYQGIDYAIANGLQRFDGGAQGEHKIARGFEPVLTYSNHCLLADEFRPAITQFLRDEAVAIHSYAEAARAALPFKQQP